MTFIYKCHKCFETNLQNASQKTIYGNSMDDIFVLFCRISLFFADKNRFSEFMTTTSESRTELENPDFRILYGCALYRHVVKTVDAKNSGTVDLYLYFVSVKKLNDTIFFTIHLYVCCFCAFTYIYCMCVYIYMFKRLTMLTDASTSFFCLTTGTLSWMWRHSQPWFRASDTSVAHR